jgi:hypothetical protein
MTDDGTLAPSLQRWRMMDDFMGRYGQFHLNKKTIKLLNV